MVTSSAVVGDQRELQETLGTAIPLITHDMVVVAENADRVLEVPSTLVVEESTQAPAGAADQERTGEEHQLRNGDDQRGERRREPVDDRRILQAVPRQVGDRRDRRDEAADFQEIEGHRTRALERPLAVLWGHAVELGIKPLIDGASQRLYTVHVRPPQT